METLFITDIRIKSGTNRFTRYGYCLVPTVSSFESLVLDDSTFEITTSNSSDVCTHIHTHTHTMRFEHCYSFSIFFGFPDLFSNSIPTATRKPFAWSSASKSRNWTIFSGAKFFLEAVHDSTVARLRSLLHPTGQREKKWIQKRTFANWIPVPFPMRN